MELSRREIKVKCQGEEVTIIEKELSDHPKKGKTAKSIFVPFYVKDGVEVEVKSMTPLHMMYLRSCI